MRIALLLILLLHGIIHFMGFAKAFDYGNMTQFTKEISKPMGLLWLLTGSLFMVSTVLIVLKQDTWPILTIIAVVVSQILVFTVWKDAKFGTIANIIMLVAAIIGFASNHFENQYKRDVRAAIEKSKTDVEIITERDLEHLPLPVKKYLVYVSIVGKPKPKNVKIIFEGEMREQGKDWFKFTSEQYNFFDEPKRLFFMKAKINELPTYGYHSYKDGGARMHIKLLSLFSVVDVKEPELFPTETVTFFNDMCLFAPSALIDDRITWETISELSVRATFTTNGTSISAILYFNETGELVDFVSNDRYSVSEMKAFPFSTPVKNYKVINGYRLPTYGEAIWHYPKGEFVYGKFELKGIAYNVFQ